MDLNKMLDQLREQRDKLNRLILAAEDYARGGAKRRGRPPRWMTATKRGRPPGSKNKTVPIAS